MGFMRLLTLSLVMLLSTLLASFAPTYLKLSPRRLSIISIYGTGLLIGAALAIVIPEGAAALYENAGSESSEVGEGAEHEHRMPEMSPYVGGALLTGFLFMYLIDSIHSHHAPPSSPDAEYGAPKSRRGSAIVYPLRQSYSAELTPLASHNEYNHGHLRNNSKGSESEDEEGRIEGRGSSLSLSRSATPSPFEGAEDHSLHHHLGSLSTKSRRSLNHTPSSSTLLTIPSTSSQSLSVVIGLLAHSLADGISLGASSLSSTATPSSASPTLDLLVFTAIMLHKAPTALALASILLSDPTSSITFIRYSLLAFSFASPFGSIFTYGLLSLLAKGSESAGGEGWWAGLALLFSGGTFLFVATHVMKSTTGQHEHTHQDEEGGGEKMSKTRETIFVVLGMITPVFLSKLVGHGH